MTIVCVCCYSEESENMGSYLSIVEGDIWEEEEEEGGVDAQLLGLVEWKGQRKMAGGEGGSVGQTWHLQHN